MTVESENILIIQSGGGGDGDEVTMKAILLLPSTFLIQSTARQFCEQYGLLYTPHVFGRYFRYHDDESRRVIDDLRPEPDRWGNSDMLGCTVLHLWLKKYRSAVPLDIEVFNVDDNTQ